MSKLNLTWEVVSFDESLLEIQLNFVDPFYISIGKIYDELIVNFTNY